MATIVKNDRMLDLAFKKLNSLEYTHTTTSTSEENGIHSISLDASKVWTENIPSSPQEALTKETIDGHPVAEAGPNKIAVTEDGVTTEFMCWQLEWDTKAIKAPGAYYIWRTEIQQNADGTAKIDEVTKRPITSKTRATGFISTKYGSEYGAQLFRQNGSNWVRHTANDWLFDYDEGILTPLSDIPAGTLMLCVYRYIGRTVKEAVGETYDEDLGKSVLPVFFLNLFK